jgi:Ca2+-binding EF-hand superfamily protein
MEGNSSTDLNELMEVLDADGSGTIDYTEFITAEIDKVFLLSSDNLRAIF